MALPFQFRHRAVDLNRLTPEKRAELEEINTKHLEDFLARLTSTGGGGLPRSKTFSFQGDGGWEVDPGVEETFGVVHIASETVHFTAIATASMYSWTPGSPVNGSIWVAEDASTTYPGTAFNSSDDLVTAAVTNTFIMPAGNTIQLHVANYGTEGFHIDVNVTLIETRTWAFGGGF